jgi:hypothetical protein
LLTSNRCVLAVAAALLATLSACSPAGPNGSSGSVPTAASSPTPVPQGSTTGGLIVLGHSGATGFNSDPDQSGTDALTNSWASGTNPDVASIYSRLLATDPGIEGRVSNAAVDGSRVDDLEGQLSRALQEQPEPGLVLIQAVDNDIRCDGTDAENYAAFQETLTEVLHKVVDASPQAKIVVVGTWATVANYTKVVAGLPNGKQSLLTGSGPCDPFDSAGKRHPDRMRYQQEVFDHYQAGLQAACSSVPACHEDGGALNRMVITGDDLAGDYSHLAILGLRKQAATEWALIRTLL